MPKPILSPAGYVPEYALAVAAGDGNARPVSEAQPLPTAATMTASPVPALSGTSSAAAVAGPFTPQLGRAIWVSLSGVWTGSVQLLRSTDGGATKLPLTYSDGTVKALWTGNANAPIAEETVATATYWLSIAPVSGTVSYRLEQ